MFVFKNLIVLSLELMETGAAPVRVVCNLNFGLSSSDSERFVPQMGAFSGEMRGKTLRMREKRRQDASKCSEDEGVKPKVQVCMPFCEMRG